MKKLITLILILGFYEANSQSVTIVPYGSGASASLYPFNIDGKGIYVGRFSTENENGNVDFFVNASPNLFGTHVGRIGYSTNYLQFFTNTPSLSMGSSQKISFSTLTKPMLFLDQDLGMGIGTNIPKSRMHLFYGGNSTGINPNSNIGFFIERDNTTYLGFGVPNNRESGILFGRPDRGSASGGIIYTASKMLQFRTFANNTRMVIDSVGNVGIVDGNTAISANLHINKAEPDILLTRTSDATSGFKLRYSTANLADIINEKNNSLRFGTNNSIKMILTGSGQLMVGNLSGASAILHAHQDIVTAKTVLKITNGLSGTIGTDGFDVGYNENALNARVWNYENGDMSFGTNNAERLTISNTGNIGIGVTPNTAKLSVNGDFSLNKVTSNATIGTINNVARNGSSILRFSGTGSITLTGIESAPDGTLLYILTTSTVSQLNFTSNSASSLDENRILTGNSSVVLGDGAVTLIYDGLDKKWRVVSVHQ